MNVDTKNMLTIGALEKSKALCDSPEDKSELGSIQSMLKEAELFVLSHSWCHEIIERFYDRGVSGVVGIFFFRIKASEGSGADEELWVIVGDVPSAYIDTIECPNGACALDAYIQAMGEWVTHVKKGDSIDDLIPVNVEPSLEYADMLQSRLELLNTHFLSNYKDELEE